MEEGVVKIRLEIRIAGTGGMGAVLAGVIIGHAAVVYGGMNAIQSQSYGSEARGTAAKSEVIISDGQIHYPKVRKSDILVAMSQSALDAYIGNTKPGSIIIIDPDLVQRHDGLDGYDVVEVPAIRLADELGVRLVANMIMLGALSRKMGLFSIDALEKAVADLVPERHREMDIKALRVGADAI